MENEADILEQTEAKLRGARHWLRPARCHVIDYRDWIRRGLLSADDAREVGPELEDLYDAGWSFFDDLEGLLGAASRLPASRPTRAEASLSDAAKMRFGIQDVSEQLGLLTEEMRKHTPKRRDQSDAIAEARMHHRCIRSVKPGVDALSVCRKTSVLRPRSTRY